MDTFFSLIKELFKHHKLEIFFFILGNLFVYYSYIDMKEWANDKDRMVKNVLKGDIHVRITDYSDWMGDIDIYGYGSNGKKIYRVVPRTWRIRKKFEIGDSIAKEYGKFDLKIIKKDTTIVVHPEVLNEILSDEDSIKRPVVRNAHRGSVPL